MSVTLLYHGPRSRVERTDAENGMTGSGQNDGFMDHIQETSAASKGARKQLLRERV